ncbi:MAG: hypothetical protein WBB00_11010 [Mycobacterium sp.]
MIRGTATTDVAGRWLIVCDCAGHPEELVGVVDVTAGGDVRVLDTGRGGAPSLTGANRLLLAAPTSKRRELVRQLKAREIPLPLVVSFIHPPCGRAVRVTEARFGELLTMAEERSGELLAIVFAYGQDRGVPLSLLCEINGREQSGATR